MKNRVDAERGPAQSGAAAQATLDEPKPHGAARTMNGARIGVLVGMRGDGQVPLVMFPGQRGSAAVAARATLDLHGPHIGREVVLIFEEGDPRRPIVVGCLPRRDGRSLPEQPGLVEVDADGERLQIVAKEQLVLRCGKAKITLTREGRILIDGTYVSSRSSGVNRIWGGSIQLN